MSERDGKLAAPAAPLAAMEPIVAATRQAALVRDIAYYTPYRSGGVSPRKP